MAEDTHTQARNDRATTITKSKKCEKEARDSDVLVAGTGSFVSGTRARFLIALPVVP